MVLLSSLLSSNKLRTALEHGKQSLKVAYFSREVNSLFSLFLPCYFKLLIHLFLPSEGQLKKSIINNVQAPQKVQYHVCFTQTDFLRHRAQMVALTVSFVSVYVFSVNEVLSKPTYLCAKRIDGSFKNFK